VFLVKTLKAVIKITESDRASSH